jgi:hypothetical protein
LAADDQQKAASSPAPSANNTAVHQSPDPQAKPVFVGNYIGNADDSNADQNRLQGAKDQWLNAVDVHWINEQAQKRPWSPEQACGAPDTIQPGDYPTAWASATPDGQREWLDVMFGEKIDGVALVVYESNAPGAIDRLCLLDEQGKLSQRQDVKDPTPTTAPSGVSIFPLVAATHGVRIELDSEHVAGWNEIDAVGLLDKKGQIHWAQWAKGSSTYADVIDQAQAGQPQTFSVANLVLDTANAQSNGEPDLEIEVAKLRANIQEQEQAARGIAITGDAKQQELAKKRARRAQVRLDLLKEELEDRLAQIRDQRAAATFQAQAQKAQEQTLFAAQQAAAAEAQARANAQQVEAERARAEAQLRAVAENNRKLQDELAALRKQAEELKSLKEQAEIRLEKSAPFDLIKARDLIKTDDLAKLDLGDRAVLRLDVETLASAKQSLGTVASKLEGELNELNVQIERSPDSTRAEVVAKAKKLRDELAGIEATIKQLDKSLEDESAKAVARQDSVRNKAAATAREEREALDRIERLEKAVQELRRAQQSPQPPQAAPQQRR